jgi:regulator of replication initiation timing|tara:strand:- start:1280 stop:1579 length:300 start_codon:yes stop_codon:yes gene_type:complete
MEVKLEYVVDLEDIPSEIAELLPDDDALGLSLDSLRDSLSKKNVEHAILDIQKVKRQIYIINRRILDLEGVARGYLNIINSESDPGAFKETGDVIAMEE